MDYGSSLSWPSIKILGSDWRWAELGIQARLLLGHPKKVNNTLYWGEKIYPMGLEPLGGLDAGF